MAKIEIEVEEAHHARVIARGDRADAVVSGKVFAAEVTVGPTLPKIESSPTATAAASRPRRPAPFSDALRHGGGILNTKAWGAADHQAATTTGPVDRLPGSALVSCAPIVNSGVKTGAIEFPDSYGRRAA